MLILAFGHRKADKCARGRERFPSVAFSPGVRPMENSVMSCDPSETPLPSGPRFWLRASRLLGAIFLEFIWNVLNIIWFPFRRRAARARIHAVILGRAPPRRVEAHMVLLPLIALLCLGQGCANKSVYKSGEHPGTSFDYQMEQLAWSVKTIADMSDARESLEDDLQSLAELTPFEEFAWDVKQLLLSPDARESLEDDLKVLAEPEFDALPETLQMFGW